jgi:predicted ATPase
MVSIRDKRPARGTPALSINGLFLSSIYRDPARSVGETFPWTLPLFCGSKQLEFSSRVTFLVGENGCGKSTLLEALAVGTRASAAGSEDLLRMKPYGPRMSWRELSASSAAAVRSTRCSCAPRMFLVIP